MANVERITLDIEGSTVVTRVEWEPYPSGDRAQQLHDPGILTVFLKGHGEFPKPYKYDGVPRHLILEGFINAGSAGEFYNSAIRGVYRRYIPYEMAIAAVEATEAARELLQENVRAIDAMPPAERVKVNENLIHLLPERETTLLKALGRKVTAFNKAEREAAK